LKRDQGSQGVRAGESSPRLRVWVVDLLHLLLIVAATWIVTWWAFERFDSRSLGALR
jgi:hypothetical protein